MDELTKSLNEIQEAADALIKSAKTKKSEEPAPEEVTDKPIPKGVAGDDVPAKPTEPVTDNPEDSDKPGDEKAPMPKPPIAKSEGCDGGSVTSEKKEEDNPANGDKADGVKNVIHKSVEDTEADIRRSFESDPAIMSALQNSEFQAAVTDAMVKSIAGVTAKVDALFESVAGLAKSQAVLAKSIVAAHTADEAITKSVTSEQKSLTDKLTDMQKSLDARFDSINKSLEALGAQPVMRKSVASVTVKNRDFNASIDGASATAATASAANNFDSLNKALVLSVMEEAVLKGETAVTPLDVCAIGSGGTVSASAKEYVMNHLPK